MQVKSSQSGNKFVLKISGHITTIGDVGEIKNHLINIDANEVEFIIGDAFVIPSALIGLLLKLVQANHKTVTIKAKDELMELLKELNLQTVFNLKKIG
jgi:hypothetical protein